MRVLVIPEDFRNDQYILKPIVEALFDHLGRPRTTVRVCQDPLLGGVTEALKPDHLAEIIDRYQGMVDLFLLCVDRDSEPNRRAQLDGLERRCQATLGTGLRFLAENAWQELEVWVLAGHDLPPEWSWAEIRAERDSKETYFQPFAKQRGVSDGPGGGRKALAEEAAQRFHRIIQLCPDDVAGRTDRIQTWLAAGTP